METVNRIASTVEGLRRAFDEAFAQPIEPEPARHSDFVAIRVEKELFALKTSELLRIEEDRAVVPLPGGTSELLGVAAIEGRLLPVFLLAPLLGIPSRGADATWIAVCRTEEPLGLAFDAMEGFLRVSANAMLPLDPTGPTPPYTSQWIRGPEGVRRVLDLHALFTTLEAKLLEAT